MSDAKRKVSLSPEEDVHHRKRVKNQCTPILKILIVGCGVGGLVAAIACRRSGHEVTILEQADELRERLDEQIGAGIQLTPNCTRVLRSLGLLPVIEAISTKPGVLAIRSYRDSGLLSASEVSKIEELYDAPYLVIHRAGLINALAGAATSAGVVLKLGSTVTEYKLEEPSVLTSDGAAFQAEIILGCDGVKSASREALLGHRDPPYPSDDTVFRCTIELDRVCQEKDLKYLAENGNVNVWFGPGSHAVSYPLEKHGVLNIVLCTEHPKGAPIFDPRKANFEELTSTLEGWDPAVVRLLRMAPAIFKWTLLETRDINKWTHPAGRFTLLGDSAHAVLPFLAQGAAQAVEDAAVLGTLLKSIETKAQIPKILRIFESIRRPRTDIICSRSQAMRDVNGMIDGSSQIERDRRLRDVPSEGYPVAWAEPAFQKTLFGYDAQAEALSALNAFLKDVSSDIKAAQ